MQPRSLQTAVEEVAPLVNDTDLLIAALSLTLCTTLLQRQPQQSPLVTDRVLPPAMALSKSPLLQVKLDTNKYILQCSVTKPLVSNGQDTLFEAVGVAFMGDVSTPILVKYSTVHHAMLCFG